MRGNGRTLIIDTSAGLSLGSLPGLEDFENGVRPFFPFADILVCSPGQLRHLDQGTSDQPSLFVRMDWTNVLRDPEFVLPPTNPCRVPILTPETASQLGAVGMACSILLGFAEEVEASCVRDSAQWALAGKARGLPIIVEVHVTGPRVALRDKAIELGASYALESGADAIALPYPGKTALEEISEFVTVPWFVQPTDLTLATQELGDAFEHGAAGVWLDHKVFALPDALEDMKMLRTLLHAREERV
jgi:DhnA family fructose-bisphosphate aldolase class Ia